MLEELEGKLLVVVNLANFGDIEKKEEDGQLGSLKKKRKITKRTRPETRSTLHIL